MINLPVWAKVLWWSILVTTLLLILSHRLGDILVGRGNALDALFIALLAALLLAPLFTEVSLLGVTLKQEVAELKRDVASVRNEVRSEIRATVSPQIYMNPPPDSVLPALEEKIRGILAEILESTAAKPTPELAPSITDDVQFLFSLRYSLEKEIRRIGQGRQVGAVRQPVPMILRALVQIGVLEQSLAKAVQEAYSVCTPAIHGEEVTAAQVNFARHLAPQLLLALRAIE